MKAIFVTGTDTNIGKTLVSAWLCYHLKADYFKPIQSGISNTFPYTDSDYIRSLNLEHTHIFKETYKLKAPLSPHLSAKQENIQINLENIVLPNIYNPNKKLIVEGAGGIYVPLNDKQFILDVILKLKLAVILVAKSTLGTINHTCLSIKILQQNGVKILGVIMVGETNQPNKEAIEKYAQIPVIAQLPLSNWEELKTIPCLIKNY